MRQFPPPEVPTSIYELSQLESLAEDLEQEGHAEESIFLRNLIRTLRELRNKMVIANLRH